MDTAPRYDGGPPALDPAWEHERLRLDRLAVMTDPATREVLDSCAPDDPREIVEIGAGRGSVARALARRHPGARVWATDVDLRHLDTGGLPNLVPLRHDANGDPAPVTGVDLIHCRSVMIFLDDPYAALERLVGWLAPGGCIVVEELAGFPPYDPTTVLGGALDAVSEVLRQDAGADPQWVRDLMTDPPGPLARHGLVDCGAQMRVYPFQAGSPASEFSRLTLEQLRPRLLGQGRLTADRLDTAVALLRDHDLDDPASAVLSVWGRRPR
ncbi:MULTISPECIES: class I SAM-dependent methyltransferase [unclassified Streptomyces]|uniref:class I SAM-dependent methyltransferase n=1 Tax=unclassified Streptomyces TaxID=2593676 RepID=UPI002E286B5B|nr:class I SAM-dependent methyltransferase [Streptomyces sp. NBC_00334]